MDKSKELSLVIENCINNKGFILLSNNIQENYNYIMEKLGSVELISTNKTKDRIYTSKVELNMPLFNGLLEKDILSFRNKVESKHNISFEEVSHNNLIVKFTDGSPNIILSNHFNRIEKDRTYFLHKGKEYSYVNYELKEEFFIRYLNESMIVEKDIYNNIISLFNNSLNKRKQEILESNIEEMKKRYS